MKNILDIITVTKDDPEGLAASIASTAKLRSLAGVRQIVIDSSSKSIADEIKVRLSGENNLEYVRQNPCGIAKAFNLGIERSNAEWLWFLNGRDEAHPKLNAELLLQILSASQAGVIVFELEWMQSGNRQIHPPIWALWPPIYGNWVPHPATLIRSGLFEQYGDFNPDYHIAMDGDLWFRLFSKNITVDMLSVPIVLYDETGISSTATVETGKEAKKLILDNLGMLIKMWLARGLHLGKALKYYILLTRSAN
jgi:glycosyltransferase involved in cell wall biosynthesis